MGSTRQTFGDGATVRITIHIDIFHDNQLGTAGSNPLQNSRLQRWEFFCPFVVSRLSTLINRGRALSQFSDVSSVVDITFDDFDTGWQIGSLATAIDHADGFAHFDEFASNGFP